MCGRVEYVQSGHNSSVSHVRAGTTALGTLGRWDMLGTLGAASSCLRRGLGALDVTSDGRDVIKFWGSPTWAYLLRELYATSSVFERTYWTQWREARQSLANICAC